MTTNNSNRNFGLASLIDTVKEEDRLPGINTIEMHEHLIDHTATVSGRCIEILDPETMKPFQLLSDEERQSLSDEEFEAYQDVLIKSGESHLKRIHGVVVGVKSGVEIDTPWDADSAKGKSRLVGSSKNRNGVAERETVVYVAGATSTGKDELESTLTITKLASSTAYIHCTDAVADVRDLKLGDIVDVTYESRLPFPSAVYHNANVIMDVDVVGEMDSEEISAVASSASVPVIQDRQAEGL